MFGHIAGFIILTIIRLTRQASGDTGHHPFPRKYGKIFMYPFERTWKWGMGW